MRKIFLFSVIVLLSIHASSQAYEGSIDYDKKKQAAIVMEYPFSADATEGALVDKLERLGLKGKQEKGLFNSSKGFRNYTSAIISDISSSSLDYYLKVEQKGKKDKEG